ncbi:MAG TPA: hypothetical protein VIL46_03270, partial [Gemmataceae bacterium]
LEFPLRASTTVGELQEYYTVQVDAPPESTLGEVIAEKLGDSKPLPGAEVRLGPLLLHVRRLSDGGRIEMVGMSIVAEDETAPAEQQKPAD